ncbi:hypothetical protein DOM21_00230 [Bacteriovorax stolpii]|uniref:Uncharacterized protein n=1 Tax=Bacteriovorax stolpii TaxID=960 RepID=A0A2K9NX52_BACTC|nr:hypothetical protein [Bacteriovorax stolpii]AUO00098.1 hypothetical protein C0V70_18700 [Bacteriovorax stolpii]QDK39911.1 hypothetical protein DOM21_00230 [Bacteriovorax stolpii]TDP54009.1 hypothetical protein C8D79_1291 [Bacteriovorax stolpii]
MKLNKKILAINLLASLLMTESAFARIQGVRTPSTGESKPSNGAATRNSSSNTVKKSEATKEEVITSQANSMASCDGDQDKEKYYPLELFQQLTRDGDSINIEQRAGNKIVVRIPPIINVCGNFLPELRQDKDSKNVTVLMRLVKRDESGKDVDQTYAQFEECLSSYKLKGKDGVESPILVDGQLKHDDIPGKLYSENIYSMDYEFDKKADVKKSVTLTFGYPKAYNDPRNGYKPLFGIEDRVKGSVPGESCMLAEKIADDSTFINKGQDVLIEEINAICKSGDAQKIAEARRSLGNADALKDIADKIKAEMDAGYLNAVKADVARIDGELKKIEEKLNKQRDTMDEATAKKEIAKYADLVKELDNKFLNPAIYRVDTLMQKRAGLEDGAPEMKAIDDEIKKLNEEIGQFSKRNPTSFASVYSVMEKYAINDAAKTVEDIRLKSYLYSKVYAGPTDEKRGKPLTFEAANKQQVEKLQRFDKTLNDWTDQYLVGQGNMYPIKKTENERQAAIDRMNSRYAAFEKKEYQDYNSYCAVGMLGSVKNPVKCKEFVSGRDKRMSAELKRREKDLYYIKGRNDKLTKMGTNYNEYQRKVASREEAEADMYEPYGSSYTSYEDNFADRYPGYYGPTTSTAYDASMYNMGGQSAAMMMGQQQQQMYYPQQQSQMMYGQQQGYQYQMPQMNQMGGQQMGAWPSI